MSRPNTPTYKTLNWPAYNKALKRRGSLTIWFDPDMVWAARPTGKRGRQPVYSDAAVQACLTMKVLFGMALRQTTGFMESLLRLIGLVSLYPNKSDSADSAHLGPFNYLGCISGRTALYSLPVLAEERKDALENQY
jgi:hypothetical protein